MRRTALLFLPLVTASGFLSGCGDPAPSTPLAPDVPAPDTSKFSQSDIEKFHQADSARGSDRPSPGNTPPGR